MMHVAATETPRLLLFHLHKLQAAAARLPSNPTSQELQSNYRVTSNQITTMDYVITRKRKRPAYDSQGDDLEAPDLLHSKTSIDPDMRPSFGLIPPIVTLPPARDDTATKEAVTVDGFIRQVITRVPGSQRKRQLRTVQLQDTSISTGADANIRPVTNKPAGDRKPMTLAQRLARAAILSHMETKEILHPPAADGISSSRRPLNFVSFPKFATPPSSLGKKLIKESASSRSESSAIIRNDRREREKQPASERPGCPPLNLVSSLEANITDASGARSHSESSAVAPNNSRRKRLKPQQISDRHGYPPLKFVPAHEAEAANVAKFPRAPKRQPITDRHGYPRLKFVTADEADAASTAKLPRPPKPRPIPDRHGYPRLKFVTADEAEAASAAKLSRPPKPRPIPDLSWLSSFEVCSCT
ncbi:uncharacterized protein EDB93DRAFT_360085 [Suillus bovinus]|uniref:uncharacterized protein n=1 Tax=Suillus bovinus TaxID=48563 RepID=UPI001B881374|nr:uncharacterized protein EDB93DRAFT_360085 [Suillus bovinus]KAG2149083.1 hypothetical protein EDB93DRAFT_360085 [Suillus bovinus]